MKIRPLLPLRRSWLPLVLSGGLMVTLISCTPSHSLAPKPEVTMPVAPQPQQIRSITPTAATQTASVAANGSLWREQGPFNDLFVLPKARRIGDIVTIQIVESSSAANQAATGTERDSSIEGGIDALFGFENEYLNNDDFSDIRKYFNPFNTNGNSSLKAALKSEFDGEGATTRSGRLTAFLTARVTQVHPNGTLEITGSREIEVNHERQIMTLRGVIRSRDISPSNIVRSTYISDARISYSGSGVIDDRQKPGWLANIINAVWPF